MYRKLRIAPALVCALFLASAASAQERRSRIDAISYAIDAEVRPNTQSLTAKATVQFLPLDDNITSAAFELNNARSTARARGRYGARGRRASRRDTSKKPRRNTPPKTFGSLPRATLFTRLRWVGRRTGG